MAADKQNLQDAFLNHVRKAKVPVTIFLINGVKLFKGRDTWPATLAHTQADYTIDLGATYANSNFGLSLARLGNFDGDGAGLDDFAISASSFNGGQGRVIVVKGKQGFSTAALDLITIDGPAGAGQRSFGSKIGGMGRFYGGAGTSMVVAASGTKAVYAFPPLSGTGYTVADALHNITDAAGNFATSMGFLGPIAGLPGVAIGTPSGNRAYLCYGTAATGPFATCYSPSGTLTTSTNFGRAVFSSAHPGTALVDSLIGDATADTVITSTAENAGPGRVYIVDGSKTTLLPALGDLNTYADVLVNLPNGWGASSAQRTGVVRDYNGDGYPDLAIGETVTGQAGRIVVLY